MTEPLKQRIIEIIRDTLREAGEEQDVLITEDDSMQTVACWDSMNFMRIFVAINDAFGLDPDFDEAIHYTSVSALYAYLKEQVASCRA